VKRRAWRKIDPDPLRRALPGGTVLHWAAGADGRGAVERRYHQCRFGPPLCQFYVQLPTDPLPAKAVRRIAEAVEPYSFDRIYGAWWERWCLLEERSGRSLSKSVYCRSGGGPVKRSN
jgi:hypothetical protein